MGRQIRPRKVYQAVAQSLASPILPNQKFTATRPPWFDVLHAVPPSEILTRHVAVQLNENKKALKRPGKPRNLYKPQQIRFPEDSLRANFYRDHPWELARPRQIVETDGCDAYRVDWSQGVVQSRMQLSGECVVQRQMWLMENEGLSQDEAYDKARREFYEERHLRELRSRISVEEARYVGAYFGKSRLELGMEEEDRAYERWKKLAAVETEKLAAMRSVVEADNETDDTVDVEAMVENA
ncbi:37S ribosomal protein S25 mitochondrial [Ceratocystis platani]|uniref:Small ribosomal subunit protein mS23 n=1 Tax=Ceratocystis fimbriata f. sp. platani TaxID=88771 RepID=A0A0F8CYJ6_CERFI|nr:37S ribosomal protein S25 mitochondrial [Ceratocystis platani]